MHVWWDLLLTRLFLGVSSIKNWWVTWEPPWPAWLPASKRDRLGNVLMLQIWKNSWCHWSANGGMKGYVTMNNIDRLKYNHPNTLLRNKNTPFLFLKSHLLSMVQSVTFHGLIRCYAKLPQFFDWGAGTMRSHSTYEFVVGHWTTFGVESWVTRIPTTARAWWCPGSWRFTDIRVPGYPPGN